MNVDILKMDTDKAAAEYLHYRRAVKKNQAARKEALAKQASEAAKSMRHVQMERSSIEKEDEALKKAYYAMSKGLKLLNIRQAFFNCGLFNDNQLPMLAIAKAHWGHAHLDVNSQEVSFNNGLSSYAKGFEVIKYPSTTFSPDLWDYRRREAVRERLGVKFLRASGRAVVPSIPARFRPDGDLSQYHILWEPIWEPTPPGDPILMKHLHGDFFVVLAQWDLTAIEKAALYARI